MIIPSLSRLFSRITSVPSHQAQLMSRLVQLANRGRITLYPHGHAMLVAVPDGRVEDWFVVGACGHLSVGDVSRAEAEQWQCPVCEEQRRADLNLEALSTRLRLLAAHESQSVAEPRVNATQSRFHGDAA